MKIFFVIILVLIVGCKNNKPLDNSMIDLSGKNIKDIIIVVKKMKFEEDEFSYSNFSFFQANNSGLYVTPPTKIDDFVLFRYTLIPEEKTTRVEGVVRSGRGPNEIELLHMSSKTLNADTLMFTSPIDKMLIVDQMGLLSEWDVDLYSKKIINFGYSFSYGNGRLLIPSFNPTHKDYLFKIYDVSDSLVYNSFPPRVPYGFEPAIRNELLGETPLPDGFAISFIGDRKVYILSSKGELKKELILGKSDEIPTPFKVSNPQEAPPATPYITKMEFYKGHLMVLVDNVIWLIEYPSLKVKSKIRLLKNKQVIESPVIDFSISDKYLYSRIGRDGVFFVETNIDWFSK